MSKNPRLFRDFPGFESDTTFRSRLVFDDSLIRTISKRGLSKAMSRPGALGTVAAVDLYAAESADLGATNRCHVLLCARPDDLDDQEMSLVPKKKLLTHRASKWMPGQWIFGIF